jgi:deazaflavin-dependent oxidoreductase (nitroreductase family)
MPHKYLENIRIFNRIILNPITKLFAGRWMYSLVYHVGRKSGKEYSTPVVAVKNNCNIFVGLSYGTDTDWFRNIQAARKCKVKINGIIYTVNQPEVVDSTKIMPQFSPFVRLLYRNAKVKQFLKLKIM